MMIALEMWGSQATGVARGLFDLMQCIEAQTDNLREDERLVFEQRLCRSNQDQGQGEQIVSHGVRERLECMERVMEDFMFCHVLFAWSGFIGSSCWSCIVARHRAILALPFEIHFE